MLKMVVMIKRKEGISRAEFRDYYETSHCKLMQHFEDCIIDYRRSYPVPELVDAGTVYNPSGAEPPDPDNQHFDCVTEVWLKSEDALRTLYARMAEPELAAIFLDDTKRFTDRSQTRFVICHEHQGL